MSKFDTPFFYSNMATAFSPFVKEILGYATEIAQVYGHQEILPAHFALALLKKTPHGYARAYIEQKIHLAQWEARLYDELKNLPTAPTEACDLSPLMELVLKEAYSEAQYFQSDIILPEYFFLALLKLHTFEGLAYQEARDFVAGKTTRLLHQHTEVNWTKQDALFQLLKRLDNLYEAQKISLKPYLHQAYSAVRGEIRGFALLLDEAQKANKITIEIVESALYESAIEQTLRFLAHRKYPLEEAFLYMYDTQTWAKVVIAPKEIFIATAQPSYSDLLGVDLASPI